MSIAMIEKEIARFLKSPEPEVICIRGKWGVGKTYRWNDFLHSAKNNHDGISLKLYAYVSLFGIASLERLKYAVFENTVGRDSIGIEPSVETFKSNTNTVMKKLGLKTLGIIASLPQTKGYVSAFQSLSYLSVKDTIICIDDLERKGKKLSMKDMLGLVSDLRDKKKCKIVLILNDDALEPNDEADFKRYNEKTIDSSLLFDPDPGDCARIAIQGKSQAQDWLRTAVISLGITNIRIIKKIERLILRAAPLLKDFDPEIMRQAVHSLTVFAWSIYYSDTAPPLDFLTHKRGRNFYGEKEKTEMSEEEKAWNSTLDQFRGFAIADEFDLELLEGIKRGYFNETALMDRTDELQRIVDANKAEGSVKAAWNLYHDSFDDNEDEVAHALFNAHRKNIQIVTPMGLNGAVSLFKDLGRQKEANEILEFYMEQRDENRNFFNLGEYAFADDINDPDVREAFENKYQSFKDELSPSEVLGEIGDSDSLSKDHIAIVSKLTADDFFQIFKTLGEKDIFRAINTIRKFGSGQNADVDIVKIKEKIEEALVRIGKESPLNKRRIQNKYGVAIED